MNKSKIVITKYDDRYIIVYFKNDKAYKIRVVNSIDELSGTIYLGRVTNVKKNISSCFVKYSNKIGYLPRKELKPETVLPVMLKKETAGNKEDELSDNISLTGVYIVVSESVENVSYSNRLSTEDKTKLNVADLKNVIIRNNAKYADDNSIKNEYNYLINEFNRIKIIKDYRTENTILYKGLNRIVEEVISEDNGEFNEIVTDDADVFNVLVEFKEKYKSLGIDILLNIKMYDSNDIKLSLVYSLAKNIDYATNRRVYLKSDAYIVIDNTEAMTVIDVNSGTTTFKGDKAEVIHKINMEAANEIAWQLKLRNISGIIIVDFINEYKKEYKDELVVAMKEALKEDDAHAKCVGLTKLGLMEITRKRMHKSLREQLWK